MTKFEELWEATQSKLRLHPEKGEHELMYTRSSYYDPASSSQKIINESNYMKMNTVKEAVQTLKSL